MLLEREEMELKLFSVEVSNFISAEHKFVFCVSHELIAEITSWIDSGSEIDV